MTDIKNGPKGDEINKTGHSFIVRDGEMRTSMQMPDPKPRINQPKGYEDSRYSGSLIRGKHHEYIFMPQGYVDPDTGMEYKAGYYDEKGNYYERVILKSGKKRETLACCDFCGTQIKLNWVKGALVSCPNCGAVLHEAPDKTIVEDQLKPVPLHPVFKERPVKRYFNEHSRTVIPAILIPTVIIVPLLVILLISTVIKPAMKARPTQYVYVDYDTGKEVTAPETEAEETTTQHDSRSYYARNPFYGPARESLYIQAAGEMFYWNSSGKYYNTEDDKYRIRYNYDENPAVWEYWVKDFSSDYGSYCGWMRYDYDTKEWTIEIENGVWRMLPESYDKRELWHLRKPGDGKYSGRDTMLIYEEGISGNAKLRDGETRSCVYLSEEQNYFDSVTKCRFYYSDQFGSGIWIYWFDYCGWVAYDAETESWYHYFEGVEGPSWEKLNSNIDNEIWHFTG